MSIVPKLKIIYFALPLVLGLGACSVTKNMIFVNGPKDLEQRINSGNMNLCNINVQRESDHTRKYYFTKPHLETNHIPYQPLLINAKTYNPEYPYVSNGVHTINK
jgi:hypothetical protein